MLSRKNRPFKKMQSFFCNKLSLVLAIVLEHFLSKVHFQLLQAETLCREQGERVIESFPLGLQRQVQEPLSVMCLRLEQLQNGEKSFIIALSHLFSDYLVKYLPCNRSLKDIHLSPTEARKGINILITFPREVQTF